MEGMYFGSVRFFKHLIVTVILLTMISLSISTVVLGMKSNKLEAQVEKIIAMAESNGQPNPFEPAEPVEVEPKIDFNKLNLDGAEEPPASTSDDGDGTSNGEDNLANTNTASLGGEPGVGLTPQANLENSGKANNGNSLGEGASQPGNSGGGGEKTKDNLVPPVVETKYSKVLPDFKVARATEYVSNPNTVFLTFDDGPSRYTQDVLDILADKDVKATFFVITNENLDEALVKKIYEQGHAIGIHTASHDYPKIYKSVEAYLEDAKLSFDKIYEITGEEPKIIRVPGGSNNPQNKFAKEITQELINRGFTYFDWNISAEDGGGKADVDTILKNSTRIPPRFSKYIALLHDGVFAKSTVEALPEVIDFYKNQGISFGKLTQTTKPIVFK